jgi:hypothetical protein
MKICIACGMPMNEPADFAMEDTTKDYCRYCCRPDGTMHSYAEKLTGMTRFIVKTQGLDEQAAQAAARQMMAKLPAWRNQA